jgi:hypothetical protein
MHPAVAAERIPAGSEGLPRKATSGVTEIPNSVIENLSLMTHAEICFALIALRVQPNPSPRNTNPRPPAISDSTWTKWTGLTSKTKDNAIRGLRNKGLEVTGEGQKALYRFDRTNWDSWVKCRPREEKAHTEAKRVDPKPKQQIHPECRDNGCQKLCDSKIVSIDSSACADLGKQVSHRSPPPQDFGKPPVTPGNSKTSPVESKTSKDSGKQVSQELVRIPTPNAKPNEYPQDFQEFIAAFLHLGIAMNTADIHNCLRHFTAMPNHSRYAAVQDVKAKSAGEWSEIEARFVPRPWNYLKRREWERRAAAPARKRQLTAAERFVLEGMGPEVKVPEFKK